MSTMTNTKHPFTLFASGLCVLGFTLTAQMAQSPLTVTPPDPTIAVGETQQFSASGGGAPTHVSAGGEYTCVHLPDGTIWCTGRNQFGQHGNGTLTDSSVLEPVSNITSATQVAAGDEFACALLANGTARCWGLGESGQRGDNSFSTFAPNFTPVAVNGLTGAVALATGYGQACALLSNATMRCWGENREGQLGNGTTANPGTAQPVAVSGITGATAITTGAYHTCALLGNGTVRCWGRNGQGQLGNGTVTNSSTPVAVSGLTGVTAVSGGGVHTCAVLTDGTVRCWGENVFGQVGDGTTATRTTPVQVVGISNAIDVSVGWRHTCALLADGTVRCWGENTFGKLGNGSTANSTTPVAVSGVTTAVGVTAGWWQHSCAVLGNGTVKCWGSNPWGQFGNGTTTNSSTPVTMQGTGGGVTWTSSNTAVATINASGRATGVSPGTTTITATDSSGNTGSTTLTVQGQGSSDPTLSVVKTGGGNGNVTSSPSGISCGSDCHEPYPNGTSVTLTANPAGNSVFLGWTGCDSVSGTTCTVTMTGARTVTAGFERKRFALNVSRTGMSGIVSSSPAGISCGTDCAAEFDSDTLVTLTASPSAFFTGWSGCDAVSGATCTVTMTSVRSVNASFLF
jgi:alpha-tubulin suppressor-like RCC1 family protein